MKLSPGWGYFIWETRWDGEKYVRRPVAGPYAYQRTAHKAAERMTADAIGQGARQHEYAYAAELDPHEMTQAVLDDYTKRNRSI